VGYFEKRRVVGRYPTLRESTNSGTHAELKPSAHTGDYRAGRPMLASDDVGGEVRSQFVKRIAASPAPTSPLTSINAIKLN
jgi:hypothetical protein